MGVPLHPGRSLPTKQDTYPSIPRQAVDRADVGAVSASAADWMLVEVQKALIGHACPLFPVLLPPLPCQPALLCPVWSAGRPSQILVFVERPMLVRLFFPGSSCTVGVPTKAVSGKRPEMVNHTGASITHGSGLRCQSGKSETCASEKGRPISGRRLHKV